MTLLVAWVGFPLFLATLGLGIGRLIEALSGARLPRALLAPVGLAAAIVLGQPATLSGATAELAVPAILAAAAGLVLSLPWRKPGLDVWALGAAVGVFGVFAAPVVLSGEPTFGGYIELDDTASWLALTERALEQGANTAGLPPRPTRRRSPSTSAAATRSAPSSRSGRGRSCSASTPHGSTSPTSPCSPRCLRSASTPWRERRPRRARCAPSPPSWQARRRCCSPTRCGVAPRRWRRRGCSRSPARSSR